MFVYCFPTTVGSVVYHNLDSARNPNQDIEGVFIDEFWKTGFIIFKTKQTIDGTKYVLFRGFPEQEYWLSHIKLSEGSNLSPWCPALEDGLVSWIEPNLLNNTSNNWSDWVTPLYSSTGSRVKSFPISLSEFNEGDLYTTTIDIETDGIKGHQFFIITVWFNDQGNIDDVYNDNCFFYRESFDADGDTKIRKIKYTKKVNDKMLRFSSKNFYIVVVVYGGTENNEGCIRFRNACVKKTTVPNPIWCRSEMDVASKNLIYSLGKDLGGNSANQIIDINVDIPQNPYILTGYRYILDSRWLGVYCSIGKNILEDDVYTMSAYVRGHGYLYHQLQITEVDGNKNIFDHGEEISDRSWYPRLGQEPEYYVDTETWIRLERNISLDIIRKSLGSESGLLISEINNSAIVLNVWWYSVKAGTNIEIAGLKVEKGSKATAWVQNDSSTLELSPNEENKIYL